MLVGLAEGGRVRFASELGEIPPLHEAVRRDLLANHFIEQPIRERERLGQEIDGDRTVTPDTVSGRRVGVPARGDTDTCNQECNDQEDLIPVHVSLLLKRFH